MKKRLKDFTEQEKREYCKKFSKCYHIDDDGKFSPVCPHALNRSSCKLDCYYVREHGEEVVEL